VFRVPLRAAASTTIVPAQARAAFSGVLRSVA
jgi:hypothetical protein